MRNFIVILTVVLIVGNSGILFATSAIPPSIEELSHLADEIIYAEVKKVKSHFETVRDDGVKTTFGGKDQIIVSEITLNILKSYKGNAQGQIILTQPGGCVLDKCLTVSLYPSFRAGERAIFFLVHEGSTDLHSIMGEYGIFRIDESGDIGQLGEPLEFVDRRLSAIISENTPQTNQGSGLEKANRALFPRGAGVLNMRGFYQGGSK